MKTIAHMPQGRVHRGLGETLASNLERVAICLFVVLFVLFALVQSRRAYRR